MDVVSIIHMDRTWQLGHPIPDRPDTRIVKFIVGPNTVDVFALPEPLPTPIDQATFYHEQLMSPTVPIVMSAAPHLEWLEVLQSYDEGALETVYEVVDLKNQRWVVGQPIPGESSTVIEKIFSDGEHIDIFALVSGVPGTGLVFRLMPLSYQRVYAKTTREKWGALMTEIARAAEGVDEDDDDDDDDGEEEEDPSVTAAVTAATRPPTTTNGQPAPAPMPPLPAPTPTPE